MGAGEARHNNSMPERKNVLINGAVPSETGYTGSDNGTLTYNGHEWGLSAGDALSCTVRVPGYTWFRAAGQQVSVSIKLIIYI